MRKKAPLCKGSWPVGPEGLSYPLHETRRNPLVKTECNIANGLRHCRSWAGGGTPSTRCICIRGKQQKRRWRKYISIHAFFCFHHARGYIHFVSSINMRKHPCLIRLYVALWVQGQCPWWVQGQCPWCRVQGPHRPLPRQTILHSLLAMITQRKSRPAQSCTRRLIFMV